MKLVSYYYLLIVLILMSCSHEEQDIIKPEYEIDVSSMTIDLPDEIAVFGRTVASEIKKSVLRMVDNGCDYSKLPDSVDISRRFYEDWYAVNPKLTRTQLVGTGMPMGMSSSEFVVRYQMLTSIQLRYIDRIIKECHQSTSNRDLLRRLVTLRDDIYKDVPEYERERLLYVVSVLFYGVQTVSEMESEGLMLKTPYNYHELQFARLKTRSEGGGTGMLPDGCQSFLATVWTIAVGEPTLFGEIVASVSTVIVAGVLLYEVVTCKDENLSTDDCVAKYTDCIANNPEWAKENSGGQGYSMCSKCLEYCRSNQKWECPRPKF